MRVGLLATMLAWMVLPYSVAMANDGPVVHPVTEARSVAYDMRLDMLERDMSQLQAQFASYGTGEDKDYGKEACCATSNWYAGFEFAILKPHLGALGVEEIVDLELTPKFDYRVSPRIWLAWDNPEGLGFRATYWQMDQSVVFAPAPPAPIEVGVAVEAHTLDLDVTQRGSLGCLEFQLAGGMRYGRLRTDLGLALPPLGAGGVGEEFEGIGPTLALDVRRAFGSRGLAFVGGVRGAWLYGDTEAETTGDIDGLLLDVEDHMMQTWLAKIGIEWSRDLAFGRVSARALWEAQTWEWAPIASLIHQDVGFSGPTFSIEFMR